MTAELNLIANQANSPLVHFREGAREAKTSRGRSANRFAGRLRARREGESLESSTVIVRNLGSEPHRRMQSKASTIRLDESSLRPSIPPNCSLHDIEPIVESDDELGTSITKIIGQSGLQRLKQFRKYDEGWEFGTGKPLSSRSLASFKLFCEQLSEQIQNEPSLFLTREGNLQLGWEGKGGDKIEFEFFPDRIEYYIEVLDDEGEIALTDTARLFDKFKSIVE